MCVRETQRIFILRVRQCGHFGKRLLVIILYKFTKLRPCCCVCVISSDYLNLNTTAQQYSGILLCFRYNGSSESRLRGKSCRRLRSVRHEISKHARVSGVYISRVNSADTLDCRLSNTDNRLREGRSVYLTTPSDIPIWR